MTNEAFNDPKLEYLKAVARHDWRPVYWKKGGLNPSAREGDTCWCSAHTTSTALPAPPASHSILLVLGKGKPAEGAAQRDEWVGQACNVPKHMCRTCFRLAAPSSSRFNSSKVSVTRSVQQARHPMQKDLFDAARGPGHAWQPSK